MPRRIALLLIAALVIAPAFACTRQPAQKAPSGAETTAPPTSETTAPATETTGPVKAAVQPTGTPYAVTLEPSNFVTGVTNPYFPLKPGDKWAYNTTTAEDRELNEVQVLDQTKKILGIDAVVVHDTVKVGGQLTEDTFDWYAQDKDGTVWYLGEDTKELENGKVVSTQGSWEAGVNGAVPGVIMQADPKPGGPWYWQEFYKGQAEDQARVLSLDGTATVPFGSFTGLLLTEERSPIEPTIVEQKLYRRGVGVVLERTTKGPKEVSVLVSHTSK